MELSEIGVYGLGVMGRNLALNLEEKGFRVSLFNRTIPDKEEGVVQNFISDHGKGRKFMAAGTVRQFVESLDRPRKILMMVKAGSPVDDVISELEPHLEENDILIDGGNSYYLDTHRRIGSLKKKGIIFVGMGVSGGQEGARYGASLMPGGDPSAWPLLKPLLEPVAARAPDDSPCCTWIGEGGAGHFVKMVHNGIEYADMELIAEAAHLMKSGLDMTNNEMSETFRIWNNGNLNGYLMEITADIFRTKDKNGTSLVDVILDVAGQKGTGKWTTETGMDLSVPLPVTTAAVLSRFVSDYKDLRLKLSSVLSGPEPFLTGTNRVEVIQSLESALLTSRIMAYAEGFYLITKAAERYGWHLNPVAIAGIWRGGCIIRSALLQVIMTAFEEAGNQHLLESDHIQRLLSDNQDRWRSVVSMAFRHGIPVPGMASALTQYDALRSARLPHYLIQAQRDYFGAHTYERTDKPRGSFFHSDWQQLLNKTN